MFCSRDNRIVIVVVLSGRTTVSAICNAIAPAGHLLAL